MFSLRFAWHAIFAAFVATAFLYENPTCQAEAPEQKQPKTWIRVSAPRSEFFLFTEDGQTWQETSNAAAATISGTGGTVVSIDESKPLLHAGTLFIATKSNGFRMNSRFGTITMDENSNALVESDPVTATLGVTNSGGKPIKVFVRSVNEPIVIEQGKQLIVKPHGKSELCSPPAIPQPPHKTGKRPVSALAASATEFRISAPQFLSIRNGALFLVAKDKLTVQTPLTNVIADNSILDVSVQLSDVRLKVLAGAAHLDTLPKPITPGTEVFLSTRTITDSIVYGADHIGRRRLQNLGKYGRINITSSDFSISSFLNQTPHTQRIAHPVSPVEKTMLQQLLKTAAAVQMVNSRYGAYRTTPSKR